MNRSIGAAAAVLLTLALTTALGSSSGAADPVPPPDGAERPRAHELPHPLEDKRQALRDHAVSSVVSGEAQVEVRGGTKVVRVGQAARPAAAARAANPRVAEPERSAASAEPLVDQYVELSQERADRVFVVLAEFGDERHPDFPDGDTDPAVPGPERFDGPRHNTIAEPDRSQDNTTVWQPDYDRRHLQDLYFAMGEGVESVRTYYEKQSSGRYTIDGTVSDWVAVPYNAARYGREDASTWDFIADAVEAWTQQQRTAGRTDEQIAAELAQYDVHDRYDFDGDGVFAEPDGYIDHFQIVHAGPGQEDGDASYGEDAIWSHRWYAFLTDQGLTGPPDNRLGGTQIGRTGVWVGDYTIQPENGGLSVFAHEYGHDLGLPDAYDTTGAADNSNEYWTLMGQSRLAGEGEPLGVRAGDLGAWEKLQLGWLDYEVVRHDERRTVELGPQEYHTDKRQGVVVTLPKKEVTVDLGAPYAGSAQFFSGAGDDLAHTMATTLDLTGRSTAGLTAQVRYEIEEGYDFAYLQASTDAGATWQPLDGTLDGVPIGTDGAGRPAIDGKQADWAELVVPLDAYAGREVVVRVLYRTDGGLTLPGLFLDDVVVTADGVTVLSEGAEAGAGSWQLDGFSVVGASATALKNHYYLMGHRSYVDHDRYLRTGPYHFGWADTRPDWAEHYAYQDGLLVSYWDTSVPDNNTSQHPGQGRNLIVDARPRPLVNSATGRPWRARIQVYDAPFGLDPSDSMTLHTLGRPAVIRGQKGQPVFSDTRPSWFQTLPNHGVLLPGVGVRAEVLRVAGTSMTVGFG